MKILAMSDTHGNFPLALRAVELSEPLDAVIHLGDGGDDADQLAQLLDIDVIRVAGNCDPYSSTPRELVWECGGKRLLLVHGDRYGVKSGISRVVQRGREVRADAVLFGHTHYATITNHSGMLLVNPGTLMRSNTPSSVAIMEITPTGITAQLRDVS